IECFADEVNEQLCKEAEDNGQSLRPRFSPGYGDLPLDLQKYFSQVLDMPKTIGVRLNDSLLMVPSKSITAFIGIARRETDQNREFKAGCALCETKDTCTYRRETS
ncbi:MAG: 5-methyltetrahydrofolate--homocysteine methyltransferase, partial [Solobacterium sp.]|nr:5-methyltetrahydrofolate--homocysteine methyltransferase [Solobacterium sp.]